MQIRTVHDVRRQLELWRDSIGIGFHPDTRGADYVDEDNNRLFTKRQAEAHDRQVYRCFEVCRAQGQDFYALAVDHIATPLVSLAG